MTSQHDVAMGARLKARLLAPGEVSLHAPGSRDRHRGGAADRDADPQQRISVPQPVVHRTRNRLLLRQGSAEQALRGPVSLLSEAVLRAASGVGRNLPPWRSIEIKSSGSRGAPLESRLHGALLAAATRAGTKEISVSLSHCDEYATATALVTATSAGDPGHEGSDYASRGELHRIALQAGSPATAAAPWRARCPARRRRRRR